MPRSRDLNIDRDIFDTVAKNRAPHLEPETGWWNVGVEEEQEIPFEGSWGNYDGVGYAPASWYLSEDGESRLRGAVDGGNEGDVIFYLPEEMWPEYKQVFTCAIVDDIGTANISIDIDGAVVLESFN